MTSADPQSLENVVIGGGPAAAAVVAALSVDPRQKITVLDIGGRIEGWREELKQRVRDISPRLWPAEAEVLRQQPSAVGGVLPEKRAFGSMFPFINNGQLDGITTLGGANGNVVSGALGGFSNVWGAQVMPFTRSTFDTWPIPYDAIVPHYRTILQLIPYAGREDDLSELFPLFGEPSDLPALAPRSAQVLNNYERRRLRVRALGITLGAARLAFESNACRECGLCMTGCPHDLIFSASQLLRRFILAGRVQYLPGALAVHISDGARDAEVTWREVDSGRLRRSSANRVFVACGGIGSTRLAGSLLDLRGQTINMQESQQFILAALSASRVADPRLADTFTLNQFNMAIRLNESGRDLPFIHFYPYNPAMADALPPVLQRNAFEPARRELFRRLTVGLGYLPSWASAGIRVTFAKQSTGSDLPEISVGPGAQTEGRMMRELLRRLRKAAPLLDLWPLPGVRLADAAKSYHFGASMPHSESPRGVESDTLGRPPGVSRVHFVDGAVLPSIPATTFTLTVMANAHRIASEVRTMNSPA